MLYKPLKIGEEVHYTPFTRMYGRAEFEFCPVFKYGLLREVYISPAQQPDLTHGFVVKTEGKVRNFYIADYSPSGSALCWHGGWCKEHKTYCMRWYVPREPCVLQPAMSCEALVIRFWSIEEE